MTPVGAHPRLRLDEVSVTFGGNRALDTVSLEIPAGEITALLGENGSGKSTLVKLLAGIYAPDGASRLAVDGTDVELPLTAVRSQDLGIRILHQDLGLVESATVAENIAYVRGFGAPRFGWVGTRRLRARARDVLDAAGVSVDPGISVRELSLRDRTLVAIARLLTGSGDGDVAGQTIVLDEPTAALDPRDAADVYAVVRESARQGAAVILITHHLEEVLEVADRVVVLQAGRLVAERPVEGMTTSALAHLMLGEDGWSGMVTPATPLDTQAEDVLAVAGVRTAVLAGIDFAVRRGEIVGVAGERSGGPAELAAVLDGTLRPRAGEIRLDGRSVPLGVAHRLVELGIVSVPEDRRRRGVQMALRIDANLALSRDRADRVRPLGPVRPRRDRGLASRWIARIDIRPADVGARVGTLSGGNQQKVAVARALTLAPRVLVLDEPTQGVDVGARAAISREVQDFVAAGGSAILFSTNLEELVELADRVLVIHRGRVVRELTRPAITRGALLESTRLHPATTRPADRVA